MIHVPNAVHHLEGRPEQVIRALQRVHPIDLGPACKCTIHVVPAARSGNFVAGMANVGAATKTMLDCLRCNKSHNLLGHVFATVLTTSKNSMQVYFLTFSTPSIHQAVRHCVVRDNW
jgi:hypothetical protein